MGEGGYDIWKTKETIRKNCTSISSLKYDWSERKAALVSIRQMLDSPNPVSFSFPLSISDPFSSQFLFLLHSPILISIYISLSNLPFLFSFHFHFIPSFSFILISSPLDRRKWSPTGFFSKHPPPNLPRGIPSQLPSFPLPPSHPSPFQEGRSAILMEGCECLSRASKVYPDFFRLFLGPVFEAVFHLLFSSKGIVDKVIFFFSFPPPLPPSLTT